MKIVKKYNKNNKNKSNLTVYDKLYMKTLGIYYNMYENRKEKYLNKKYNHLENKIYYDKKYKSYITPIDCSYATEDINFLVDNLVRDNFIYTYKLNGEHTHCHHLSHILLDAYNESEVFELENENEFSEQELIIIKKLVEKGKNDRKTLDN